MQILVCQLMVSTVHANSLDFDGVNDYLVAPGGSLGSVFDFAGSDFTIEAWVKSTTSGVVQNIVTARGSDFNEGDRYYLQINSSDKAQLYVNLGNSSSEDGIAISTTSVADGQWHHIAAVRSDIRTLKIYVDGVLEDTDTIIGSVTSQVNINQAVTFGSNHFPNPTTGRDKYFKGQLDELRFWDDARTVTEIKMAANHELVGSEVNLVAYYDFNQGTAGGNNTGISTVTDRTASARHATLGDFAKSGSSSNFVAETTRPSLVTAACGSGEQLFPLQNPGSWSATASSFLDTRVAANIIDNRVTPSSPSTWHSDSGVNGYVTIDMGEVKSIDGLQYFFDAGNGNARFSDYEVFVSTDNLTYESVASGTLLTSLADGSTAAQFIKFPSTVSARYFRLFSISTRNYVGGVELMPMVCAQHNQASRAEFDPASCSRESLNTGYDSGSDLAYASTLHRYDDAWLTVKIADATTDTVAAANAVTEWQQAIVSRSASGWRVSSSTRAEWIGDSYNHVHGGNSDRLFRNDFVIDVPDNAYGQDLIAMMSPMTLDFYSDNATYDILINGTSLRAAGHSGFSDNYTLDGYSTNATPVSWTMDPDLLQPGNNTLIVHLKSASGAMGMLALFANANSCYGFDFGDAPDSYGTTSSATGAAHILASNNLLLGNVVAADAGDSVATDSSDDGVTFQSNNGEGFKITAVVTGINSTGADAMLCGYLDGAADGVVDSVFSRNMSYTGGVGQGNDDLAGAGNEELCIVVPGTTGSTLVELDNTSGFYGAAASCQTAVDNSFSCDFDFLPNFAASVTTYARFRLTSDADFFSNSSPSPTGVADDGEVEDYQITVDPTSAVIDSVRITSVPVRHYLSAFSDAQLGAMLDLHATGEVNVDADRDATIDLLSNLLDPDRDGHIAIVRWSTLEEIGTAGFFIDRSEAGSDEWQRLNSQLLPGLVDAPLGGDYRYIDIGALRGVDYFYRLIEQEAWGTQRKYGPYHLRY